MIGTHFRRIRRTVVLVWRSAPGWTLANVVLLFLQGVMPFVALYLLKGIIDAVTRGAASGDPAVLRQAALLVAAAAVAALASALFAAAGRVVTELQTQIVTDGIFDRLHAKSLEADLEYYETPGYYDTLHLAQAEAPYRAPSVVSGLVQTLRSGVSLAAVLGLLFAFDWRVACVLAAVAAPAMAVKLRTARARYRLRRGQTSDERLAAYCSWIMTIDEHAKENRLLALGGEFSLRFRHLRIRIRDALRRLAVNRAVRELAAQAGFTVAAFGLLFLMAVRAVRGEITLGHLVMLFAAIQRGQGFISEFLGGVAGLYENSLFVTNFYAFLDLPVRVREPAVPRPVPASPWRRGIRIEGVAFAYAGSERPALRDVTFEIHPGEHVALVGENGSGKTTLVKLLCRLYDPLSGRIEVDGTDLREVGAAAWRRRIGVLFQDYCRYRFSARENIWFGDVTLPFESPAVETAAVQAGADAVIRSLPAGYETRLGKWFEDGEELSVGQWQKIALARCFLRRADLLIFDEPTSALDARAEHAFFEQFRRLAAGRTAVLISHRMSTVRGADRIVVLAGGTVAEQGTHEALMRSGGLYANLFRMQAERYG